MAEPTEEELIEIANGFLLNAPPGEFMEVVTGAFGIARVLLAPLDRALVLLARFVKIQMCVHCCRRSRC